MPNCSDFTIGLGPNLGARGSGAVKQSQLTNKVSGFEIGKNYIPISIVKIVNLTMN